MPRKADEPSAHQVRLITEIERVIVPAKADPKHQPDAVCDISRQAAEPGVIRSAPASQTRSQMAAPRLTGGCQPPQRSHALCGFHGTRAAPAPHTAPKTREVQGSTSLLSRLFLDSQSSLTSAQRFVQLR
jgi:hypothetical protein